MADDPGVREPAAVEDTHLRFVAAVFDRYRRPLLEHLGRVNVVPVGFGFGVIRSYPLPIVQNDDKSIPADEWVSRVITVANTNAGSLVPILRPLMPQEAHLAAHGNQLVVADRYANVQRITALVKTLDKAVPEER